jgi:hypothetical protein
MENIPVEMLNLLRPAMRVNSTRSTLDFYMQDVLAAVAGGLWIQFSAHAF